MNVLEQILQDRMLGLSYYHSRYCPEARKIEYEYISKPQGISVEEYATSSCILTAEMIRFLLTGTDDRWRNVMLPKGDVIYITAYGGDHEFVIYDGKMYDSWWQEYTVVSRPVDKKMMDNIRRGDPFTFIRHSDGQRIEYDDYDCFEPCERAIDNDEMIERFHSLFTD